MESTFNLKIRSKENAMKTVKKYAASLMMLFLIFFIASDGQAQSSQQVTGVVLDNGGIPLIGVNIMVKGTTNGVITDIDGKFSISATPQDVLVFSYIGYLNQEIGIGNQSVLNITMKENIQGLDEVVVVGYGAVKKKDLTGAVGSINSQKIMQVAVTNPAMAIQGRVPGVLVTQTDFSPSGGLEIRVRGNRSMKATNDPLYVVDGMPLVSGSLNNIDPNDIESIDILKDASATAIYGSRGANGVIIVTTKKGKSGKVQVDYNGYISIQTVARKLDLMNAGEWVEYMRESLRYATGNDQYLSSTPNAGEDANVERFKKDPYVLRNILNAYDDAGNWNINKVQGYDWLGATLQTGLAHNHHLNVRGGSDKTQYSFSLSYTGNEGVVKNRSFERMIGRTNIESQISKVFKAGMTLQYAHTHEDLNTDLYENASKIYPAAIPYGDDGKLIEKPGGDDVTYNIFYDLIDGNAVNQRKRDRMQGTAYIEANIWDGLKFRSNLGIDYDNYTDGQYYASHSWKNKGGMSNAKKSGQKSCGFTLDNMLIYSKTFARDHTVGVTAVQSIQTSVTDTYSLENKDIPISYQQWNNLGASAEVPVIGSGYTRWALASFLGRANYSYKDRYLLTVSARYDGSSRLAKGHKWVLFPSAALAWRVNEESFMKNIGFISNLKLRIGWGRTGNSAVDPYQTQGRLSDAKYIFGTSGSDGYMGFRPSHLANKELKWETTDQTNLGLDFGFLQGRISGSIDLYLQKTHDLLMERKLPTALGYDNIIFNIGKTQNKGIEIALSTVNIQSSKGFTWMTDWVFYANREEIVELYKGKQDDIGNKWFIGQPISVWYDYKFDGIWQNTPEDLAEIEKYNEKTANLYRPGRIRVVDQNKDYQIMENDDRVIIGNPRPKCIVSMMNTFAYKGLDMSIYMYADVGRTIKYNANMYFNGRENQPRFNYWTPQNPSNEYPAPAYQDADKRLSSLRYHSGTFLRVRDITLGYTLPKAISQKAFMDKCRFYATVQNPFLITRFPGVDPEAAQGNQYPLVRSYMFGVNVSF